MTDYESAPLTVEETYIMEAKRRQKKETVVAEKAAPSDKPKSRRGRKPKTDEEKLAIRQKQLAALEKGRQTLREKRAQKLQEAIKQEKKEQKQEIIPLSKPSLAVEEPKRVSIQKQVKITVPEDPEVVVNEVDDYGQKDMIIVDPVKQDWIKNFMDFSVFLSRGKHRRHKLHPNAPQYLPDQDSPFVFDGDRIDGYNKERDLLVKTGDQLIGNANAQFGQIESQLFQKDLHQAFVERGTRHLLNPAPDQSANVPHLLGGGGQASFIRNIFGQVQNTKGVYQQL